MRKFFGFEKASTLDNGSALGGALAMQGINQLRRIGFGGSKKEQKVVQEEMQHQLQKLINLIIGLQIKEKVRQNY